MFQPDLYPYYSRLLDLIILAFATECHEEPLELAAGCFIGTYHIYIYYCNINYDRAREKTARFQTVNLFFKEIILGDNETRRRLLKICGAYVERDWLFIHSGICSGN